MGNRLYGKTAVIFGGAGRIGSSVAAAYAAEAATLILIDRDETKLQKTREKLSSICDKQHPSISLDIGSERDVRSMLEAVEKLTESVDILVNCPAYIFRAPFLQHPIEEVEKQWHANVRSVYMVTQAIVNNLMIKNGYGKIINLASVGGQFPEKQHVGHCAAKAAIIAISKVMALELACHGIQVNVVAPGPTETTPFSSSFYAEHPEILEAIEKKTPTGRIGHPEDHVGLMVFLASQESDWITGQVIFSDGGLSLV